MTTVPAQWRMAHPLLVGGGLLLLAAGALMADLSAEALRPAAVRAQELAYLPKGEYLKLASLGYRQLVSDLLWLKAVQHIGGRKVKDEDLFWAFHVIDVVTDVDPQFVAAYQIGGVVLGVWGGRPQDSITLLTKGIMHNPEVWQLPFYVGYDYFYELRDPVRAAEFFRMAGALPGAPDYLPNLAARMTVEAGDPDAALEFLERLYRQTPDERLREALMERSKDVIIERDIRMLEQAARRYHGRFRRWPARLEELARSGFVTAVPREPFGGAYVFGSTPGTVASTVRRDRLKVLQSPRAASSGTPGGQP